MNRRWHLLFLRPLRPQSQGRQSSQENVNNSICYSMFGENPGRPCRCAYSRKELTEVGHVACAAGYVTLSIVT